MKHKYNIPNLLASIVGYRGVPFPGLLLRKEKQQQGPEYEIGTEPEPMQEFVKAYRLWDTDAKGRWYFMPVSLKHPQIPTDGNICYLPHGVVSISCKKTIVETPLVGRKGSVKELISTDDYKISVAAFIQSANGLYPEQEITLLRDVFNIAEPLELICALTGLVLDEGDKVVLTDISFPPLPGVEDAVAVKLEMITDKAFELTM